MKPINIEKYMNDYCVDECGNVFSIKNNSIRQMKPQVGRNGYLYVPLCINNSVANFYIHRLVAFTYIDKVHGKDYVNHIDGNKKNNNVSNLEWCTVSENKLHSINVLGEKLAIHTKEGKLKSANAMKQSKAVVDSVDMASEIAEFIYALKLSLREASRLIGISRPVICKILNNESVAYKNI